jgi:hypothetical protein
VEQSKYFVRDMLRRFRVQQEDGVLASDVEQTGALVSGLIALLLWKHQALLSVPRRADDHGSLD